MAKVEKERKQDPAGNQNLTKQKHVTALVTAAANGWGLNQEHTTMDQFLRNETIAPSTPNFPNHYPTTPKSVAPCQIPI